LETAKNSFFNQNTMGTHPQTTNTPKFTPIKNQKTCKTQDKTGKTQKTWEQPKTTPTTKKHTKTQPNNKQNHIHAPATHIFTKIERKKPIEKAPLTKTRWEHTTK
jgi:hypothetical protein